MADALSRKDKDELEEEVETQTQGTEKELLAVVKPYWRDFQALVDEAKEDDDLRKIVADITKDPNKHPVFTIENGRLHYKGRSVVSAKSSWVPKLLVEYHTTPT